MFRSHPARLARPAELRSRPTKTAQSGQSGQPHHAIDPERGARAGYDGHKRCQCFKVHDLSIYRQLRARRHLVFLMLITTGTRETFPHP